MLLRGLSLKQLQSSLLLLLLLLLLLIVLLLSFCSHLSPGSQSQPSIARNSLMV